MITCLNLGYRCVVPVAERCDGQVELPLVVSLTEELLTDLKAPLLADLPRTAGVRDVGAFQRDLENQLPVLAVLHIQGVGVEVTLQTKKNII